MKIREKQENDFTPNMINSLDKIRNMRNFSAKDTIHAKAVMLNEYMSNASLSSCVIGISGGIDSAVVLGIVSYASSLNNSPITNIMAVALPSINDDGVTRQEGAMIRAQEAGHKFLNRDIPCINIQPFVSLMRQTVEKEVGMQEDAWAHGQATANMRTPVLYYLTSLLTANDNSGIVIGTTNRDEGAYLGYVGKASDGMVDVQIIGDLHKSEVRSCGEFLGVPDSIMNIEPTGDMFDGTNDVDVFGAPYDAVEMLIEFKCMPMYEDTLKSDWNDEDFRIWNIMSSNLERLHKYNAHKYQIEPQGIFLDTQERGCPGGWKIQNIIPNQYPPHINGEFDDSRW